MKVVNNTHYFSISNKVYNIVPDNDSWQFESAKRLSYSQCLYWEYKYCKSVGGQAFFYTFTYNNDNLPYFDYDSFDSTGKLVKNHVPCFNYKHIRLITNGLISKHLRRHYGSQLRYFVACERGEGKGVRGKGKNPHYHVIFFISPLSDSVRKSKDVPYRRISPIAFCHLCKCVWQYNSSPNKYDHLVADYKSAKFGHCQPGDDLGLVTDFDALSYVSKYVVKDSDQSLDDFAIKEYYRRYFTSLGYTWHSLYSYYLYLRSQGSVNDKHDFLDFSGLSLYIRHRSFNPASRHFTSVTSFLLESGYSEQFSEFWRLFKFYFDNLYLPSLISQKYRDYCNMYGSKVRCSKSLGIYGLSFIHDIDSNPHFVINKSDEVVSQPLTLYYYRKVYMNIVHCPVTGNPLYVLNERGIDLKCRCLSKSLDKCYNDLSSCFDYFECNFDNSSLWSFAAFKDLSKSDYLDLISCNDFNLVLYRYSVYRLVYQYRHFSSFDDCSAISNGFTFANICSDYRCFLQSNFYTTDFSETRLIKFVQLHSDNSYVSFSSHPSFSSFSRLFDLIEGFYDVFRSFQSEIKKREFSDSQKLRQKINSVKYFSVNSI